jgi:rod shape-determining protein MreC
MAMVRRSTGSPRLTLALLVVASITVLTFDQRGAGALDGLRSLAATAFSPLRGAGDAVTDPVQDRWDGLWRYGDVKDENDRLRQEVTELRTQADAGAQAQAQLDAIAAAQDLTLLSQHPTTVARVSGGPVSNFDHTVQLDKGSDAGLAVGMPVVVGRALVGRITQVEGGHAAVQLLVDPDARVGVALTRSGQRGTVAGQGAGQPLTMGGDVPVGVAIPPDETVFTGPSSIYPPDLEVGRVTKVGPASDGLTQTVEVTPSADLDHLSYVTVILEVRP